jgi:NADH-quinone oxidoreductase subunit L
MQTPSLAPLVGIETAVAPAAGAWSIHTTVAVVSSVVALLGIGLAWLFYIARPDLAEATKKTAQSLGLYTLSYNKFFIDEIYVVLIVRPLEGLAWLFAAIDRYLIDGLVNLFGELPRGVGYIFRPIQGGLVPFYALVMALGVLALAGALMW